MTLFYNEAAGHTRKIWSGDWDKTKGLVTIERFLDPLIFAFQRSL